MLEEELNMAPLSVIGIDPSPTARRREAIFFISQRIIILSNSDVRSFHKSEKMKGSTFRDFNVGGSNERTMCILAELFIGLEKLVRANRVCPASQISFAMFLAFHGLFFVSSCPVPGER